MISNVRLAILFVAALVGFASGAFVTDLIWDRRSDRLLAEREAKLRSQCNDTITTLKDTNDDLQKNLSSIRHRYYAALRLQPVCLRVDTGMADH